jgi:hypothetical protein
MDSVAFITTETGDDLIVSFAVRDRNDPAAIESLTLMRTPKYEFVFEDHERGVRISFERYDDEDDDYLQEVIYSEAESTVRLKTSSRRYELDVRKVDTKELRKMRQVLGKMNYDQRVQMSGV